MTEKLFWNDMYMREFDAKILKVDGNRLFLDRTAFNPRGGGLVSDTGTIGGSRVLEVIKENEEPVHIVERPELFKSDSFVHCVLDWDRRYRVMRMHTSAHILSAIVNRETGALITGAQINPNESRIDFSLEEFDREKFSDYLKMSNEVINKAIEVKTYFMRREEAMKVPGLVKLAGAVPPTVEELRIVQIGEVDTQADGGVHVKNTQEIGEIISTKLDNKGKSNRRLYFSLKP